MSAWHIADVPPGRRMSAFGGKEDIDTAEYQFDGLNPYGGHV